MSASPVAAPPLYPGSQRFLRVRRFSPTNGTTGTDLPNAYAIRTETTGGDHGSCSFYMPKILQDGNPSEWASVAKKDIIRVGSWNWVTLAWEGGGVFRVVQIVDLTIPEGGGIPGVKVICEDVSKDLEQCVIFPYGGAGRTPWGDMRHFGWQAPELNDAPGSGWTSPNVRSIQANPNPGGHPPYGLAGKPFTWPNPLSQWIWGQAPIGGADPVGFNFFRYTFTTAAALDITIYVTADDLFIAALDGTEILEFQRVPDDAAGWTHYRRVRLAAGTHTFCVRAENLARPGIVNNTGLVNVAATYDTARTLVPTWGTHTTRQYLFTTSSGPPPGIGTAGPNGWRSRAYPDPRPGMTAGQILGIAYTEGVARSELPGWNISFSNTLDSSGNSWGEIIPDYQTRIGRSFFELIKELEDQGWITYTINKEAMTLDVYRSAHVYPLVATALAGAVNLTALTHTLQAAANTDRLLARTENGWVSRGAGTTSGTIAISDMSDPSSVDAYLDRVIARSQSRQDSASVSFVANHINLRPYQGVDPRKRITIPDRGAGTQTETITKMTVEDQPVGPPVTKIELISTRTQAERQIALVQDRNAPGSMKGRSSSIAPTTKEQPQSGELRLTEMSFNLPDVAKNAADNAVAQGLAYADSADDRAPFRMQLQRVKLIARNPQSGEAAPTGSSAVQLMVNGVVAMTMSLTGAVYEANDWFGSTIIWPPQITANWFLEVGPEDGLHVRLVTAGTHRNLRLILYGYQVP